MRLAPLLTPIMHLVECGHKYFGAYLVRLDHVLCSHGDCGGYYHGLYDLSVVS